jgi:hypothetical protein
MPRRRAQRTAPGAECRALRLLPDRVPAPLRLGKRDGERERHRALARVELAVGAPRQLPAKQWLQGVRRFKQAREQHTKEGRGPSPW